MRSRQPNRLYLPWPARFVVGLTALGAFVGATAAGCLMCNDIGCGGGFELEARTVGDTGLQAGAYTIEITLEETRYAIDCTIAETVGESECSEPTRVGGDGDFTLSFSLAHSGNDWNPDLPAAGFYLYAADHSGSDDDGSYSETRGPEQVHVLVQRDGDTLVDMGYDVTYERNDDYRGDERCGYCDELQTRELEISP